MAFLYHNEPFLIRFARRFTVHNPVCLSPVSGIRVVLILDVPPLPLVMDWGRVIDLAQRNRFAVRANGHRRVVEGDRLP